MVVVVGVVRCESLKLTFQTEFVLLFPLPQLQLLLCHCLFPLSCHRRMCIEVLLLFDSGIGTSLNCCVQLLGVVHQLLCLGVELVCHSLPSVVLDLHHVEVLLPHLCLLHLRGRPLLVQGDPHREAQPFFIDALPLPTEHIVRLVQCKMGSCPSPQRGRQSLAP
jgi:hypothetical protein